LLPFSVTAKIRCVGREELVWLLIRKLRSIASPPHAISMAALVRGDQADLSKRAEGPPKRREAAQAKRGSKRL
jgi:hypothetical protein